MVLCVIDKILEHNVYILKTKNENYQMILEFYGLGRIKAGDKLLINEQLLDIRSKQYTQPYAFELQNDYAGKVTKDMNDPEYIVLNKNNKNFVLKRVYG